MSPFVSPSRFRDVAVVVAFLCVGHAAGQDAKAVLDKVGSPAGLAKVRAKLAGDPVGARVRVDSFTLDGEAIKVAGVMLVPGATEEDRAAVEKATRAKLIAVVQEVAGAEDFKEFDLAGLKPVPADHLPPVRLQQVANAAGEAAADELMFTDAKFNAKGELVVSGRRGTNPKTMEWLKAAAPRALAENFAALGPDGKPAPVVFDLRELPKGIAWPLVPSEIQKRVAGAKRPGLARLRVDRAYLAASPAKPDETNPAGVSWTYVLSGVVIGTQPVAKEDVNHLTREIMPAVFSAAKWPAITSGDLEGLTVADARVPDPAPKLQAVIALAPAFDGVRIDPRTEFGPDGKLVLVGLQPGLDEKGEELLAAGMREMLVALASGPDGNLRYKTIADRGISLAKLERVKVRELHARLRQFAAEKLDETRLARLYYDDAGTLTLTCDTIASANGGAAKAELKAHAEKLRVPVAVAEPVVKPSPAPLKGSLAAYLRGQIADPKNPQWDAVLVERGYFNDKDQFTLRGVVSTEKQKAELVELFDALAKETQWANHFTPAPVAEPDVAIIPMEKLVERAARVTPAYPTFDGIRITGAKYVLEKDAKGVPGQTLVFVAHTVGKTDAKAPAALQALIAEDTRTFARRLPKDRAIRIEQDEKQPRADRDVADFSIGFAAEALAGGKLDKAKELIEMGLLHYPTDSTVWFLSAYYHHLKGDEELVRRDLCRTIDLEARLDPAGRARTRRYEAAKALQGEKRDELEKLWLKYWKESKDGAKPLKFAREK